MRGTRWMLSALLFATSWAGCGDDDDDDDDIAGEGEGEEDSTLDILVNAAAGVLSDVQSVRAYYLNPEVTSCDGLTSRRVRPDEFPNRHEPVFVVWSPPGNPHIITAIASGSSQVLIEAYATEAENGASCTAETAADDCADGERCIFDFCIPEPRAAGCETNVYVAPGDRFNTSIQVRLNP